LVSCLWVCKFDKFCKLDGTKTKRQNVVCNAK
jgi:hypothetical protein